MAHPFFDSIAYPWHRADAVEFHRALYRTVTKPDRIELLYNRCGDSLPPLPLAEPADIIWKAALRELVAARKLESFCTLARREQSLAAIVPVIDKIVAATDVLMQFVLKTDRTTELAFVNRRKLRTGLEQIALGDSAVGVILVRGDPKTGRTWTRHLVESKAAEIGEGPTLYLYDGNVANVNTVLKQVFNALGKPKKIPKQNTSPNAWYLECFLTMQEIALQRSDKKRLWIVIDDLGETQYGPKLDPEIRVFFEQFALQMANPAFSQFFRLVLIEYPRGPVPTKWKKETWLEDDTVEAPPKTEDIAEFLRQWGLSINKVLPSDEATRLSSKILDKVKEQNALECCSTHWERVHEELKLILKEL